MIAAAGKEIAADPAKAVEWLRKAVDQNNAAAAFNLAVFTPRVPAWPRTTSRRQNYSAKRGTE
jgi:TPR repeat protein